MLASTHCTVLLFLLLTVILFLLYSVTIKESARSSRITQNDVVPDYHLPKLEPLQGNYARKLFNLDFNYKLRPENCSEMLALIVVTSYFGNVEARSAMRRAFATAELNTMGVRRVFLLGEAPGDPYTSQMAILNESQRFGDIVQGNFREAYRNLTYKHLMGLKWASEYCNQAKYVIKMDDDIVINVKKVVDLLSKTQFPSTNLIAGYILRKMLPVREPANKWYVTKDEYKEAVYPTFVSGWFYITTPKMCSKFILLSHYRKYFWIDDVFVTGILARDLNVKHYDLGRFFTVHPEFLNCCVNDVRKNIDCELLVGPNGGDNNLFYQFNTVMKLCEGGRCDVREKSLNETCVAERKFNLGKGDAIIRNYKLS